MSIKPILFNGDMVRALLDNRKTVTRQVMKGADPLWGFDGMETNPAMAKVRKNGEEYSVDMPGLWAVFELDGYIEYYPMIKAPYEPSSVMYVRETWNTNPLHDFGDEPNEYVYKADYDGHAGEFGWRPSIHMPREAARIFLRVTDVRVERLRDISLYDVWNEGTPQMPGNDDADGAVGHEDFAYLWNRTIKPADRALYGWDANPWVWVIQFERISKEEAING